MPACDNAVFKIDIVFVLPLAKIKIFVHTRAQMQVHTVGLVPKSISSAMEKLLLPFSVVLTNLNTASEWIRLIKSMINFNFKAQTQMVFASQA